MKYIRVKLPADGKIVGINQHRYCHKTRSGKGRPRKTDYIRETTRYTTHYIPIYDA